MATRPKEADPGHGADRGGHGDSVLMERERREPPEDPSVPEPPPPEDDDERTDREAEETFPASDPPANY
jgi:hypothetical protein